MKRKPIKDYGYDFITGAHIPPDKDEYYLRNQQIADWQAVWRPLTAEEQIQLEQQGNYCPTWCDVWVEDPIDLTLIRNNYFYGLVRIGSMTPYTVGYHDFILPEGIRDSHIISCDIGRHSVIHRCGYLSHFIIGQQCILSEIDEMDATNHAKFGNGIVKDGEEESVRIWLNIMNEEESRSVLPFESLLCGDAWLWGTYREKELFRQRLLELTELECDTRLGWYAEVGSFSVIKSCRVIKDVQFGPHVYVKGANKLKNLTIRSHATSPTQIGEGVELVNGIIGYGCRVFYGVKAVRFVMGNNSNLKYGARLLNSVLGDNSTISCCEVLNTLVFPFHEQHHNNSFLIAALIMGQSNMAAGANLGSNHNTRGKDGELRAGRGFWPALSSSLKFNSVFASFTLIIKGDYPHELHVPIPFSMVGYQESTEQVTLMPAYWWLYNRYALERNEWKFKNRDKRVFPGQHVETEYMAPDTMEEILLAMDLLSLWVGQAAIKASLIAPHLVANNSAIQKQGRILLETHPEQVADLIVLATGIERSAVPALVLKVAEGYRGYREMLIFGTMKILLEYVNQHKLSVYSFQQETNIWLQESFRNREAVSGPFKNMGGQLVSEPQILRLIQQVEGQQLKSWQAIHDQYDSWWGEYPRVKAIVALQVLQQLLRVAQLEEEQWNYAIQQFLLLCEQNAIEVVRSRQKDFEEPFSKIVYRNDEEVKAVLGSLEDNSFVKESRITMEHLKELARHFATWL
ncbi:MAG: DUF4954 family protein [Sphaerochaetaceae bacterium]